MHQTGLNFILSIDFQAELDEVIIKFVRHPVSTDKLGDYLGWKKRGADDHLSITPRNFLNLSITPRNFLNLSVSLESENIIHSNEKMLRNCTTVTSPHG